MQGQGSPSLVAAKVAAAGASEPADREVCPAQKPREVAEHQVVEVASYWVSSGLHYFHSCHCLAIEAALHCLTTAAAAGLPGASSCPANLTMKNKSKKI